MKLFAILPLAMLATASIASAQPAVPHPGACKADAAKLCPDAIASMDRSKVQDCLKQKIAQVSMDCKANLIAMKAGQSAAPATTKQ